MTSVIGKCTLIIIFYMLRDYNRLKDIEDRRRIAKEYKDTYKPVHITIFKNDYINKDNK